MKNLMTLGLLFLSLSLCSQTKLLKAESNHSTVGFNISIAGFSKVSGKFNNYEILLDWNEKNLDASKISASIQVNSIDTGIPDRDAHLLTSDFFDAETYKEIKFQSDSIIRVDFSNFEAHGRLSMHGVTKEFTLPFQIVKIDGNTVGVKSKTTLNRLDYNVGDTFKHSSIPNFLSDEIEIEIYFWTKKRK